MARLVKTHSNEAAEWDKALVLYREQLGFYLDSLVECECREQILANVEAEVRKRSVPDDFKFRFLVRTLVQKVIEHVRECPGGSEALQHSHQDRLSSVGKSPVQERLVYFMRDVLEYSTRDTSLLIGITDAQVENLLSFARKRIDMTEGSCRVKIQAPEWTYFRWKFEDLHLN